MTPFGRAKGSRLGKTPRQIIFTPCLGIFTPSLAVTKRCAKSANKPRFPLQIEA